MGVSYGLKVELTSLSLIFYVGVVKPNEKIRHIVNIHAIVEIAIKIDLTLPNPIKKERNRKRNENCESKSK